VPTSAVPVHFRMPVFGRWSPVYYLNNPLAFPLNPVAEELKFELALAVPALSGVSVATSPENCARWLMRR